MNLVLHIYLRENENTNSLLSSFYFLILKIIFYDTRKLYPFTGTFGETF